MEKLVGRVNRWSEWSGLGARRCWSILKGSPRTLLDFVKLSAPFKGFPYNLSVPKYLFASQKIFLKPIAPRTFISSLTEPLKRQTKEKLSEIYFLFVLKTIWVSCSFSFHFSVQITSAAIKYFVIIRVEWQM